MAGTNLSGPLCAEFDDFGNYLRFSIHSYLPLSRFGFIDIYAGLSFDDDAYDDGAYKYLEEGNEMIHYEVGLDAGYPNFEIGESFEFGIKEFKYESQYNRFTLGGELGIKKNEKSYGGSFRGAIADGTLDSIYLSCNMEIPLGTTGVYIVSLGGGIGNLAVDLPIYVEADIGLLVGKEVYGVYPLKGNVRGKLIFDDPVSFSLVGTATVLCDQFQIGYACIAVDKSGLIASGIFTTPFVTTNLDAVINPEKFKVVSKGMLTIPNAVPLLGGRTLGQATVGILFCDSHDCNETVIFGGADLGCISYWYPTWSGWKESRHCLTGSMVFDVANYVDTWDLAGSIHADHGWKYVDEYKYLRSKDRRARNGAAPSSTVTVPEAYSILIFRLAWNSEAGTDFNLTDPAGKIFAFDVPSEEYYYSRNANDAYYVVGNPAEGEWQVELTNPENITDYDVEVIKVNSPPQLVSFEAAMAGENGLVASWDIWDEESDPIEATLMLSADINDQSGHIIADGVVEYGSGETFNLSGIPSGDYYPCLVFKDEYSIMKKECAANRIRVMNQDAPGTPENFRLTPVDGGAIATWDPVENAAAYRLYYSRAGHVNIRDYKQFIDTTTGEIDGLKNGHEYSFAISAVTKAGDEGLKSDPVNIIIKQTAMNNEPFIKTLRLPEGIPANTLFATIIQAVDQDNDAITFSLEQAPDGMDIRPDSGMVSWMPFDFQIGIHSIVVKAEDGKGGEDSVTYTINVFDTSRSKGSPEFASTPVTQAVAGQDYSYLLLADDPNGEDVTLRLIAGPETMVLENGRLIWSPQPADLGKHDIVVSAADDQNTVYQAFELNVSDGSLVREVESYRQTIPTLLEALDVELDGMDPTLNGLNIHFPQYAHMQAFDLSVSGLGDLPAPLPDYMHFLGKTMNIRSDGVAFQIPADIGIPFDDVEFPAGFDAGSVRIVRFSPTEKKWRQLDNQAVDKTNSRVAAKARSFSSTYALVATECDARAVFTADVSASVDGVLTVAFDSGGSWGQTFQWDFGDGQTDTDPNPTHTYAGNQAYTVTLTVTGQEDCGDSATYIINRVSEENNPPSKPMLTLRDDGQLDAGAFADPDNDPIGRVVWEITEGGNTVFRVENSKALLTVPELFLDPALAYAGRVKFADIRGAESEWSDIVQVPVFDPGTDENGNGIADARELENPGAVFPDVSADHTAFGQLPGADGMVAAFAVDPVRNVSAVTHLKITDPMTLSDTGPEFSPAALVNFRMLVNQGAVAKLAVHVSRSLPEWSKWHTYDEVDGKYAPYGYSFFNADRRSVTLEFRDGGFGDRDGVENGVIVVAPSGSAIDPEQCAMSAFIAEPDSGETPLPVSFDSEGSAGELAWDFGDGTQARGESNPSHTFGSAGIHTVTLTATGANGCTHITHKTVEILPTTESADSEDCFVSAIRAYPGHWPGGLLSAMLFLIVFIIIRKQIIPIN